MEMKKEPSISDLALFMCSEEGGQPVGDASLRPKSESCR